MKKIILSILLLFFVSNAVLAKLVNAVEVSDDNKKLQVSILSGISSVYEIGYKSYTDKLAHIIFNNWDYNEPESSASATVLLNIDRNGIVKDCR